jgi:DNA-binding CsgD family transcriptional regulator
MDLHASLAAVSVRSMGDARKAAEAMRDIVLECTGLHVIAVDNIASKAPMEDIDGNILAADVFGWTGENEHWWKDSKLALSSPLPRASGFFTRQPNPYLDEMSLDNFEKRALTKASIVVPVHLPFGQIGAVCFVSRDASRTDLSAEYEQWADILALMSHRFLAGYVKAHRTRRWLPGDCQLTKREVECLRWASIGKTDKEISLILSRSHATVRFHIQNAGEKLNAVNRSQTIFKAAQLGYLGAAA